VRSERNLGGAGGFAELVRLGLQTGADWLWLMDDDAEPERDAIQQLLASPAAADPATAVLATSVRTPGGALELLHRGHVARFLRILPAEAYVPGTTPSLGFASFVGFCVRASVAREIGLPRAELFIGADDVEYSIRARRHGTIRLVPESVVVHKLGMGGGSPTRRSRFWNRVLRQDWTSASWEGYWKNLYAVRNFVWLRRHHAGLSPPAFVLLTAAYVVRSLLYDRRPLRRVPWIVRFAWNGWRGNFAAPTPAEWAARAARSR
jgi:GT2 family glycosyltransferase